MVPCIVAGGAGHGCVPAGPLPRLVQRNTLIGPVYRPLSKVNMSLLHCAFEILVTKLPLDL
jgi:hypothetical protein